MMTEILENNPEFPEEDLNNFGEGQINENINQNHASKDIHQDQDDNIGKQIEKELER